MPKAPNELPESQVSPDPKQERRTGRRWPRGARQVCSRSGREHDPGAAAHRAAGKGECQADQPSADRRGML